MVSYIQKNYCIGSLVESELHFSPYQSRIYHLTVDQCRHVVSYMTQTLKEKKYSITVFLYIAQAFVRVYWHDCLIYSKHLLYVSILYIFLFCNPIWTYGVQLQHQNQIKSSFNAGKILPSYVDKYTRWFQCVEIFAQSNEQFRLSE